MHIFATSITFKKINATKLKAILNKKQTYHHTFYKKNVNWFTLDFLIYLYKFTILKINDCLSLLFMKTVNLHK